MKPIKTTTRHTADTADERLAALEGLSVAALTAAVKVGLLARASCTENDPPHLRGILFQARTVRGLRENTAHLGWYRNGSSYSLALSPSGNIAIQVASGDENTGVLSGNPMTRSEKGRHTLAAVETNEEMYFGGLFRDGGLPEEELQEPIDLLGRQTWILLVHVAGDEARMELSLPVDVVDNHVSGWVERIMLPPIPLDSAITEVEPDFGPDLTIEITRRSAGDDV